MLTARNLILGFSLQQLRQVWIDGRQIAHSLEVIRALRERGVV